MHFAMMQHFFGFFFGERPAGIDGQVADFVGIVGLGLMGIPFHAGECTVMDS